MSCIINTTWLIAYGSISTSGLELWRWRWSSLPCNQSGVGHTIRTTASYFHSHWKLEEVLYSFGSACFGFYL